MKGMKQSWQFFGTLFMALVMCLSSSLALATNAIEAVAVSRQGADITMKISLQNALSEPPPGFAVSNPARLAFDFAATKNGMKTNSRTLNEGNLRSMNLVEVGDRTRLVLNLTNSMNFRTHTDGKDLYIVMTPVERVTETAGGKTTRFAEESLIGKRHRVHDINFRRGKDGEGRVLVDLSDVGTGIDIREQGGRLIVDFLKTSIPETLRRKLDVTDFATPVVSVETKSIGDNVRMTITPNGLWEHNAYQSEKQFVVEVKRIVEDPNKLTQGSKVGYQGPRVSINYQNGDVRALLRLMAEELGLNAVISETVVGSTTLVLKDVPADQVIDIIFQQRGLDMRRKGNIIMIAPRDEIAIREKQDFESRQQLSELEPLKMEQFILNYQKANDIARLLRGANVGGGGGAGGGAGAANQANNPQRILSKRGSVVADPQSNTIFVNDISSKLDEIRNFIKAIDINARQVLIEARVVEATDSFNRELGVKMGLFDGRTTNIGGSGLGIQGSRYTASGEANDLGLVPVVPTIGTIGAAEGMGSSAVNLPISSSTGGSLAFSLFNSSMSRILSVELQALQEDGLGKIISSPRVITANNVKAKIEDGTEVPYTSVSNSGTEVEFKSAKLSLEVTPQITPEGTIKMQLVVKKEEPDWTRTVLGQPPLKSSIVETVVVVDNGGTVVIGGVSQTSTQNSTSKVPWLGDIPLVGWLFKYDNKTIQRRELLVFISPRIVSDKMRID